MSRIHGLVSYSKCTGTKEAKKRKLHTDLFVRSQDLTMAFYQQAHARTHTQHQNTLDAAAGETKTSHGSNRISSNVCHAHSEAVRRRFISCCKSVTHCVHCVQCARCTVDGMPSKWYGWRIGCCVRCHYVMDRQSGYIAP